MRFLWPYMLVTLLLVPLFVLLYLNVQRRRSMLSSGWSSLVQAAPSRAPGARRHIPQALFFLGLTLLLLSLARPQATVTLPRVESTVLLAFDVSGSMAADDFQPTRMDAAKAAARAFIERQPPGVKVGVVAFSENGFAVQPPTDDQPTLLAAIERLTPQRGTALGHGIYASLSTIAGFTIQPPEPEGEAAPEIEPTPPPMAAELYENSAILLLSDGENNANPDPLDAAQSAGERGVRIYTVGIGSPEGTLLKVEGFTVVTQRNDALLQRISEISGGEYHTADNAEDLLAVYDQLSPKLVMKEERMEITALFAGVGLVFLLAGGIFSLAWFNRLP